MMFAYVEAAEADGSITLALRGLIGLSRKRVVFTWLPRCPHGVSVIKTIMTNLLSSLQRNHPQLSNPAIDENLKLICEIKLF